MADMIESTSAEGVVSYTTAADTGSVFSAPIDAFTQLMAGKPLSSTEGWALATTVGVLTYGFGHHNGYKDRDAGKPKKLLGLI